MKKGESKDINKFTPKQLQLLRNLAKQQVIKEVNIEYKAKTAYQTDQEYNLPGIYLLEFDSGIKVGMSKDIKHRMLNYKKPWCMPILRQKFFYTNEYQTLENEILKKTKYNRNTNYSNEWITNFTLEDLCKEVEILVTIVDPYNY